MDKEQLVEFLQNNLTLETTPIHDSLGNPMGYEICLKIFHNKENHTIAHNELYFD